MSPVNSKRTVVGVELGCSELSSILGHDPYRSANEVLAKHIAAKKHGDQPKDAPNGFMLFGQYAEVGIRLWAEDSLGLKIEAGEETGVNGVTRNPAVLGLGASLDGIVLAPDEPATVYDWYKDAHTITEPLVWECKTTPTGEGPLPAHILIQVQGQLLCADLERAMVSRVPRSRPELQTFIIKAHQPTQLAIIEAVEQFWIRVQTEEWYPAETKADLELVYREGNREVTPVQIDEPKFCETVNRYHVVKDHLKSLTQEQEALEHRIKDRMREIEIAHTKDGMAIRWTTVSVSGKPERVVPESPARTYRRFQVTQHSPERRTDD